MSSGLFGSDDAENAVRVIKSLISQKHTFRAKDSDAESRVDYLSDILGMGKSEVVAVVEKMRQEGILADSKDISAFLMDDGRNERKSRTRLEYFLKLEEFLLRCISSEGVLRLSYKQLNDRAVNEGIVSSTEKDIRTLMHFLCIYRYIRKQEDPFHNLELELLSEQENADRRYERRAVISAFTVEWLYGPVYAAGRESGNSADDSASGGVVVFSEVELLNQLTANGGGLFTQTSDICLAEVEEALLYLSRIGVIKLEGGFFVLYNAMSIKRLKENRLRYRLEDYRMLSEFYRQKIQQVHIVGEYANLMVRDYEAALRYVQDYFRMDYKIFIEKYFKGDRAREIQVNITPKKHKELFGSLSPTQMEIISDRESRCIVVAAGPGSGKTRVLVHKLASLLLLEDVKHEQLLMLTFSRAAATEFKQRLTGLIGQSAHFVDIKTFHSFCFDLLGRVGRLEDADDVVAQATRMISEGKVEPSRIGKTVLVIDEAQDMGADEYALVKALMGRSEDMRVIAVGDDDQNIFSFRGADSRCLYALSQTEGGRLYEMTDNFRSASHIVRFANAFVQKISHRLKSKPVISACGENGRVELIRYDGRFLYQPLVRQLLRNRGHGSSGVLTQTNEDAVMLHGRSCPEKIIHR